MLFRSASSVAVEIAAGRDQFHGETSGGTSAADGHGCRTGDRAGGLFDEQHLVIDGACLRDDGKVVVAITRQVAQRGQPRAACCREVVSRRTEVFALDHFIHEAAKSAFIPDECLWMPRPITGGNFCRPT